MFEFITELIIRLGVFFSKYFEKKQTGNIKVFILIFLTFFPLMVFANYWVSTDKVWSKILYWGILGTLLQTVLAWFLVMYVRKKAKKDKDK